MKFHFSLANFLLAIIPVAVVLGVVRVLDLNIRESRFVLVFVVVVGISIAIGAIQGGTQGMWKGLVRGLVAIVIGVGGIALFFAILWLSRH